MSIGFKGPKDKPVRPTLKCGPSMTKQSFREHVEINNVIARYRRSGVVDHLNRNPGYFGDVSGIKSYQESLNIVIEAQEKFSSLPANLRERFGNDPASYIKFISDRKNYDEAVKLGLVIPKKEPEAPIGKQVADAVKEGIKESVKKSSKSIDD